MFDEDVNPDGLICDTMIETRRIASNHFSYGAHTYAVTDQPGWVFCR